MKEEGKIPEGGSGRNLSQTAKRSAKYRNPKGPAKYFAPYKNLKYIVDEEISANDVKVPVAPLRSELNQKIWTSDNKLKPEVRQALLDIANSYFESLDLDLKVKDILFTGSLANFGWTDGSDIDLHLLVDYNELGDIPFLEDYLYLKKKNWIDNHNISIYGFDVEPFAKDIEKEYKYKAIYSILNDQWIVPPKKDKPVIDFETVQEKSASIMNDIDRIVDITNNEEKIKESEKLKEKLGGLRNIGLNKGGEYSNENLIYKTLRRAGYLDKLDDTGYRAFDQKMSLNERIEKSGGDYVVYPKKGGHRLGTHDTKAGALRQLAAIEASKARRGVQQEEEEIVNLGVTPMVHTLDVQRGIDGMTPEKVSIVKDFISFVCGKLKMSEPVHVFLRRGRDEFIETTASYVPSSNTNHIRCGGRALVDILRSIAHELVHNRQREVGMFGEGEKVQNIGGHIEDQANSVAGIFIKDFTHNYGYDNIYDL